MRMFKRIFLFIAINILVVFTISLILNLFHIRPYLSAYGIDYQSLMIFCLVWGMGGAFISLALSRKMAKWLMGVKVIDENTNDPQLRDLVQTIHSLARQARLTYMPDVGIYESKEVNAFATGPTQKRSLVAVSSGLLNRMSQNEIEGVLAHEITHIANGDMVTMTLLQGVVNAFVMFLARALAFAFSGLGRSRQGSSHGGSYIGYSLLVFLFDICFMLLGSIVICWFSRLREFRADRGGAEIAGKEKMIAALESLQSAQRLRDQKAEKPVFQSMKISSGTRSGLIQLLSSHPPLEKRIARLRALP
jgi:heat shock protein HtpX